MKQVIDGPALSYLVKPTLFAVLFLDISLILIPIANLALR